MLAYPNKNYIIVMILELPLVIPLWLREIRHNRCSSYSPYVYTKYISYILTSHYWLIYRLEECLD